LKPAVGGFVQVGRLRPVALRNVLDLGRFVGVVRFEGIFDHVRHAGQRRERGVKHPIGGGGAVQTLGVDVQGTLFVEPDQVLRGPLEGLPSGFVALETDPRLAAGNVPHVDGVGGVRQALLVRHGYDVAERDHAGAGRALRSQQLFLHDIVSRLYRPPDMIPATGRGPPRAVGRGGVGRNLAQVSPLRVQAQRRRCRAAFPITAEYPNLLVEPLPYPYDGYPSEWVHTLHKMAELDATTIVPGHGPVMHDKTYLYLVADLMQSSVDQVRARIRQLGFPGGHALDEIKGSVDLMPFRQKVAGNDKELQAAFDDMAASLVKITFSEAAQRQAMNCEGRIACDHHSASVVRNNSIRASHRQTFQTILVVETIQYGFAPQRVAGGAAVAAGIVRLRRVLWRRCRRPEAQVRPSLVTMRHPRWQGQFEVASGQ